MAKKTAKQNRKTKQRPSVANDADIKEQLASMPPASFAKHKGHLLIAIIDRSKKINRLVGLSDPRIAFCKEFNSIVEHEQAYPISIDF